jgi:hypothetical protein
MPANRYGSLPEALEAFKSCMARFFAQSDEEMRELRVHPVFGPLNHEEWERSHFKHFFHHLLQFGLIEG